MILNGEHNHSSHTPNAIYLKPFTVCVTVWHQKTCTYTRACVHKGTLRVWIHNNHKVRTEGGRYQNFQMAVKSAWLYSMQATKCAIQLVCVQLNMC